MIEAGGAPAADARRDPGYLLPMAAGVEDAGADPIPGERRPAGREHTWAYGVIGREGIVEKEGRELPLECQHEAEEVIEVGLRKVGLGVIRRVPVAVDVVVFQNPVPDRILSLGNSGGVEVGGGLDDGREFRGLGNGPG